METYTEEVALLVAQTGPLNGQRWAIKENLLVGREATCNIVISDRQISRHHAQLLLTPEGIVLEDLGSKNGTNHNGEPVIEPTLLQDGDIVQIALAQKFVFLSSDATVPLEGQDISFMGSDSTGSDSIKTKVHRLSLDKRSRRVWLYITEDDLKPEKKEILPALSVSQFSLLELLYKNPGRVVPRRECITAVWGEEHAFEVSEQALDALVRRLRDRIALIDPVHNYVITVRGHGLRLENPEITGM